MKRLAFSETIGLLSGVPPERIAARSKAWQPVYDLKRARSVREIYLGGGLSPTSERVKLFERSQEELSKIFWDGVNVDYSKL